MRTRRIVLGWAWCLLIASAAWGQEVRNVVLMIGDGMGFEQVTAASFHAHGVDGALAMQRMPHQGRAMTFAADARVTDSAAAATAMATGRKVNNGVLSRAIPGDGEALETLLEAFQRAGRATGLVSTTPLTHATPAAFAAHRGSRSRLEEIAADMLAVRPTVMLGGGGQGLTVERAAAAGYHVVTARGELESLSADATAVAGLFGTGNLPYEYDHAAMTDAGYDTLPHLHEMTAAALRILQRHEGGFFLMVEGGRIDHAGHINADNDEARQLKTARSIYETLAFDRAVQVVLDWAKDRSDTLVVVTADHETGGLKVLAGREAGQWPDVTWAHGRHTDVDTPLAAWGPGGQGFAGTRDNTAIYHLIHRAALVRPDQPAQDDAPAKAGVAGD